MADRRCYVLQVVQASIAPDGLQFQEVQEGLRIITGLGRRTTARDRGRGRKLRRHRRADMRSSGEAGFETLSLRDLPVEVGEELPADKGLLCVKV